MEPRDNAAHPRDYMDGLPIDVQACIEGQRRRDAEMRQRLDEKHKRDMKAAEEAKAKQDAEDEAKREKLLAESRAIAQEQLDAKLEDIHIAYLNAGGTEKDWPAFRERKAEAIITNQIMEQERRARATFESYARGGNPNAGYGESLKPFDV